MAEDIELTNNRWNDIFQEHGRIFSDPHEDLPAIAAKLQDRQAKSVLDLGCGSGRHLVYFTQQGFQVVGIDYAEAGLRMARQWLDELGLPARLHRQDMTQQLAFSNACFDAVISIQVVHHARLATIRRIVAEIERVLKPGGLVFVSVAIAKQRKEKYEEVEPNTFIPVEGREKGLLHYFFSPEELREVFEKYEIARIYEDSTRHLCLEGYKIMRHIHRNHQ